MGKAPCRHKTLSLARAFITVRRAEWEALQNRGLELERAILLSRFRP
ncbi:hypothetical protein [Synechocystis sp. LKSZ1]